MADINTGVIFNQSGVPVQGSADYQRVFDSRWRFMEIFMERTFTVSLPALPEVGFAARYTDDTPIVKHSLGFPPWFETDFLTQDFLTYNAPVSVYANKDTVFLRRTVSTLGAESQSITLTLRIYNLPVLEDYEAPKGLPQGTTSPRSSMGVKMLDGSVHGITPGSNSPNGFSVDTTKKILSIHRHGLAKINEYNNRSCRVTAIDTSTNILTIASVTTGGPAIKDISWAKTAGLSMSYFPGDFVTYPSPLVSGSPYYIIPVDDTHVKLAASYDAALAGIEIDITTTGSIPGTMNGRVNSLAMENSIEHDVGYPPTFLLAQVDRDSYYTTDGAVIGPMLNHLVARVTADSRYLSFVGVQAVFSGWYGFVILKDPAEIAR